MRTILLVISLLLVGAAFAGSGPMSCLEECCQKYGGTMDSHGCSIQPGDSGFQAYTTCSGYCVSGTAPPSTSDGDDVTSAPPPTTTAAPTTGDVAPTTYEEPPSDEGTGCMPAFALLGVLGLTAFVRTRE